MCTEKENIDRSQDLEAAEGAKEMLDMLGVLFSRRLTADEKEEILFEKYQIPKDNARKERFIAMGNLSDAIYADGYQKGYKEGYQKGYQEGRQEGRIEVLCEAVVKGVMSVAAAMPMSGCTKEEFSGWMHKFYPDYKI